MKKLLASGGATGEIIATAMKVQQSKVRARKEEVEILGKRIENLEKELKTKRWEWEKASRKPRGRLRRAWGAGR